MSFETDDMDMNQSILKTMKKIVEKMEKEDARTKKIGDDMMPNEIKKKLEGMVNAECKLKVLHYITSDSILERRQSSFLRMRIRE